MTSLWLCSSNPNLHIYSKLSDFVMIDHIISTICFLLFLVVCCWVLASLMILVSTYKYAVKSESANFLSAIRFRVSWMKHWSPVVR